MSGSDRAKKTCFQAGCHVTSFLDIYNHGCVGRLSWEGKGTRSMAMVAAATSPYFCHLVEPQEHEEEDESDEVAGSGDGGGGRGGGGGGEGGGSGRGGRGASSPWGREERTG